MKVGKSTAGEEERTLNDAQCRLLRPIFPGEFVHTAVALQIDQGSGKLRVSKTLVEPFHKSATAKIAHFTPASRPISLLKSISHPSPPFNPPRPPSSLSPFRSSNPKIRKQNPPLSQPHNQIPQWPLLRKTRDPPPARLAIILRPMASPQRIPNHILTCGCRYDIGVIGESAYDRHAREALGGRCGEGSYDGCGCGGEGAEGRVGAGEE